MPIYNSDTGEITKAYFFTTCIGVSSLLFIKAYPNTKKESYIDGNASAFNYYGATPLYLTPDNDKSAVTRVCKYDPVINPTFLDMANYYALLCCRQGSQDLRTKARLKRQSLTVWNEM